MKNESGSRKSPSACAPGRRHRTCARAMAVLCAAGLLAQPGSTAAHSGHTFSAQLTAAVVVDGVLSPGEWSDADMEAFSLCSGVHAGQMYVKNDATHLYIAVVVETVRWNFGGSGADFLNVRFDNDHDGLVDIGDNGWNVRGGDSLNVDSFNPNGIGTFATNDLSAAGTTDFQGAVTHTDPAEGHVGTYTVEYRGLLDSADDLHDFSLVAGQTVGVSFTLADAAPVCVFNHWPSANPTLFADITIAAADVIRPIVGPVFPTTADPTEIYSASYSDDTGVLGCNLFLDDTDQGAMTLSSPGDPSGTASLTLTLPAASYSAQVSCTDGSGNVGEGPAVTIDVLTPQEQIAGLSDLVDSAEASGSLNAGQANALRSKLDHAIRKLNSGNCAAAKNQLNAFINHVSDLAATGVLTPEEGGTLVAEAQDILAELLCGAGPRREVDTREGPLGPRE